MDLLAGCATLRWEPRKVKVGDIRSPCGELTSTKRKDNKEQAWGLVEEVWRLSRISIQGWNASVLVGNVACYGCMNWTVWQVR